LGKIDTAVHSFPQTSRPLEGHNPPGFQHHVFASRRVPSFARALALYAEFTEPGDQDIITGFQGCLYLFNQAFGNLDAFALGQAQFDLEAFHDVVFRQGHEGGYSGWSEVEKGGESEDINRINSF
jgi:hypothetical protein